VTDNQVSVRLGDIEGSVEPVSTLLREHREVLCCPVFTEGPGDEPVIVGRRLCPEDEELRHRSHDVADEIRPSCK
jgi:hypothetical protein